jgi:hypothetical protein
VAELRVVGTMTDDDGMAVEFGVDGTSVVLRCPPLSLRIATMDRARIVEFRGLLARADLLAGEAADDAG